MCCVLCFVFFFKQKTAYEMRISDWSSDVCSSDLAGYARLTRFLVARPKKMLLTYSGLIAATIALFWVTPGGFIPAQDQGYFLAVVQLPSGASLERTDKVTREVAAKILPIKGLRGAVMFAGFQGPSQTQAPNSAAIYFPLKTLADRTSVVVGRRVSARVEIGG